MLGYLQPYLEQVVRAITEHSPRIVIGFGILFFGWIVARLAQRGSKALFERMGMDKAIPQRGQVPISQTASGGIFLFVMLFVVLFFLDYVKLTIVAAPIEVILSKIGSVIPNVVGAVILGVIAYLLARLGRAALVTFGEKMGVDNWFAKVGIKKEEGRAAPSKLAGDILFFVVILIFLPAIFSYLRIDALRTPLQGLIEKLLGFAVNVAGSLLIVAIAWFVGNLARTFVASILSAININSFAESIGLRLEGKNRLSQWGGDVVFALIILLSLPPALANLNLPTLADPISNLVQRFFGYLPNILAALVIFALAWIVGRVVGELLERLLSTVQFDTALDKMGIKGIKDPNKLVVRTASTLARVVIILFGTLEALETLRLEALADLMLKAILFVPAIVGAVLILGAGLFLANLVSDLVQHWSEGLGKTQGKVISKAAYAAVVIFTLSVALEQLAIGAEIITAVVKISLAGIAVAFALAVGLGGKDFVAAWIDKRWKKK